MTLLWSTVGVACAALAATACDGAVTHTTVQPATRPSVSWHAPRCAGVQSCLLGRVTTEGARPLAKAAVFLESEQGEAAKNTRSIRLQTLTDDEGVFTVENPPPGRYRIAVYKDARMIEVRGVELGAEGTVLVPVTLAP